MHESFGCAEVAGGLTDYLEGALPPGIEAEFARHCRTCGGCRRELRQIRWTLGRLAAMPREPVPPGMKATLLQALRRRRSA